MKKAKISIIIPVYNAEKYIAKCLDSVVNQSFKDFEIICVNDGSKDSSLSILKEYQKKYDNINVINQKNTGVIGARIVGYNASSGEYIGWIDADDFVEEDMLIKMYTKAIEYDADVVYCNYKFYPNEVINKQKWFKEYDGKITWEFIMNNTIQWNKLVKKSLLDSLDIASLFENIGEGCYGIVLLSAKKIVSINDELYNYRVGHESLSSNFNNVNWYSIVVQRSFNMLEYVINNKYSNKWIEYYKYRYLYYNLILMIIAAFNNEKTIYLNSKNVIKKEKLFSKKYKKYLVSSFSLTKYYYFKFLGIRSFLIMKFISRMVLK